MRANPNTNNLVRIGLLAMAAVLPVLATGCYQKMAEQPKVKMHTVSEFFTDGRSNRPYEEGTVARGMLAENEHFYSGLRDGGPANAWKDLNPAKQALTSEQAKAPYHDTFPVEVTEELVLRGKERFNIYCGVCHGSTGAANGMIVQRGFLPPPSFHVDNSRGLKYLTGASIPLPDAPAGYYFQVITHGYGAMGSYSAQVSPKDRWAIIAYIRALQETFSKAPAKAVAQKEAK